MTTLTREPEVPTRFRWTRQQYDALVESGVFGDRSHIELIGGELVTEGMLDRMAQKSTHGWTIRRIERILTEVFGEGFDLRAQFPISLLEDNEPEPDIAVVVGTEDDYKDAHPNTAILVVEVSDSTLRFDRTHKASLYAAAGIQEYWIDNLVEGMVEVYRDPVRDDDQPFGFRYRSITQHLPGETITPLANPSASIPIESLLP